MREIKYVLQTAVLLFFFVLSVIVLLNAYRLFARGYQVLGNKIDHSSIEIIAEDYRGENAE